ncbi:MAG: hypothetical protein ACPG47_07520, partial [Leucothrix sp.]
MKNIWIIGCGDIGLRVTKHLTNLYQNQTPNTSALVQSESSAEKCTRLGINTLIYNLDKPKPLDTQTFHNAEIYYFAPPPKNGETDPRLHHFLEQLKDAP